MSRAKIVTDGDCDICNTHGTNAFCMRCHSYIGCNGAQPGQIVFLDDCTHELRGKRVELPELSSQ